MICCNNGGFQRRAYLLGVRAGKLLEGTATGVALWLLGIAEDVALEPATELAGVRDALLLRAGKRGSEVIALSGFSRCSWSGPSPRRISARESGTVLLCQPWSD